MNASLPRLAFFWLAPCLMALLLAGCSTPPAREAPAPVQEGVGVRPEPAEASPPAPPALPPAHAVHAAPSAAAGDAAELLAYARRYGALSAEARRKEYGNVMQALSRDRKDSVTRLRAALLLGMPGNPRRDPARAIALLTEVQQDMSLDDHARMLATLLRGHLEERQKLEEQTAALGLRLKEEQQKAETLQQKAEALQQKLEELTRIERSMMERSRGTAP